MKPEHIEDILVALHPGQWFGWSDANNKVYANLVIHGDQEKPTEEWLNAELKNQLDENKFEYEKVIEKAADQIENFLTKIDS